MPIYEFRCTRCGLLFEKLCSTGEGGEILKCPGCSIPRPARVMSSFIPAGVQGGKETGAGCETCRARNCSSCGQ